MSFGKDYRLIGEATVTGEKHRASRAFWSALAHTDIIGRIKDMVEHYAIIGEYIDKPLVYDRDELIEWLTARSSNCLMCYPYWVSEEGQTSVTKDHPRFMSEFFVKMKEIGLSWKEFQTYYGWCIDQYFLRQPDSPTCEWDEKEILKWHPRPETLFTNCLSPENFVGVFDEIAKNRKRLHELPAA